MKSHNPTTPSRRQVKSIEMKKLVTRSRPHKSLTRGAKRHVGRNSDGRITTRHKGAGHKRLFRDIDFLYDKFDIPARVETVEYDPNRGALISLVAYQDGEKRYVLAPKSFSPGAMFVVSEKAPIEAGNRLPLAKIPQGSLVFNVELKPRGGAKLARGAGNYAEVAAKDRPYAHLKMPSGEVRKVLETCWATLGEVGNPERKLRSLGKAGRSRWLGIRPTVRGTAMNPVDHPHGGGEGRQGRGLRRAKSKWGKPTGKGQKTRRAKKYSNYLIVSRRRKKKK